MNFLPTNVRQLKGAALHPCFFHPGLHAVLLLLCALIPLTPSAAKGVYQEPTDFLKEIFNGQVPSPQTLWITKDIGQGVEEILGHHLNVMRVHYWAQGSRSVWILEEVGKEQPITVGIVINAGHIEQMRVLIYRESRGDEVRQPFFLDQFKGAVLQNDEQLDRSIDGVSGATLSTRALTKLAKLALYLDQQRDTHGSP